MKTYKARAEAFSRASYPVQALLISLASILLVSLYAQLVKALI